MAKIKANNVIGNIFKNVKKVKWKCLHKNCNNNAINSHLGQKKGILSELQVGGHIIQLKTTDIHNASYRKKPLQFKKLGIRSAISLPVFCNAHDTSLFKTIEVGKVDFSSYNTFLLFSYRTLCAEIRKKEISKEQNKRMIASRLLEGKIDKVFLKGSNTGLDMGIRDLSFLKKRFEDEIDNPLEIYQYWSVELPKYELFASAIMSVLPVKIKSSDESEFENLYIHLIPNNAKTLLLIGYDKKYPTVAMHDYCLSWKELLKDELDVKITTLLTNHIENWVMSPNLFDSLSSTKKKIYLKDFLQDINNFGVPEEDKSFNLFE